MKASNGDEALLQSMMAKISPNRNAAKLVEMFGDPKFLAQQGKDLGLAGQVEPIPEAYAHFVGRNPLGVKQAFDMQYDSMLQAIGAPMMVAAIPVMREVTAMFSAMGGFANSNPTAIKWIAEGLGALAAGLIGAGVATMFVLGGIPAAIGGAVLAVGALVALNWPYVVAGFRGIGSAISGCGDLIKSGWDRFAAWIKGAGSLGGAIGQVFAGLGSAILNALKAVVDQIIHGVGSLFSSKPGAPSAKDIGNELLGKGGTPMRFEPSSSRDKPQPIALSLNVDGRTLAQTISDQLDSLSRYDTNSPAVNGTGRYGA